MSPWFKMWVAPRQTIQSVIKTDPRKGVFIIATALALENLFFYGNMWSLGLHAQFLTLLIIALILCPLFGYLWISILSRIFTFTGRWYGGKAPFLHLRAAVAWSKIPAFGILLSWGCIFWIAPQEAFIYEGGGDYRVIFFNLLNTIFAIWSFVLLIYALQEVQKFSFIRAVRNMLTAYVIFSIPCSLVIFAFFFFYRG